MAPRTRRERGSVFEFPSGSLRVTVSAGTDPLTDRVRQLRETHATYHEAEKALTRIQGQVDEDRHPKSEIIVRRAIEQWLDTPGTSSMIGSPGSGRPATLAVVELEDTTRERYDDLIRPYVLPTFGALPAARLDAELLERFYARLHRCCVLSCNGKSRGGHVCKPLGTSTTPRRRRPGSRRRTPRPTNGAGSP